MPNLTLILLTKNESQNIKDNFYWLKQCPAITEIIHIDDNSTDDTIEQVKKLASKNLIVVSENRGLNHNFSEQRQFALSKSTNDWILWLDADEEPTLKLIEFLNQFDANQYDNYGFKRRDVFLGHTLHYGETSSQYFLRLFNKKHGKFIHPVHEIWQSDKPAKNLDLEIIHTSHKTLKSFFEKINLYSELRARELYDAKVTTNLFQIIFYPKAKFIQNYIFRQGYKDGTAGIILALGMSFHSFLVRAKLWTYLHP